MLLSGKLDYISDCFCLDIVQGDFKADNSHVRQKRPETPEFIKTLRDGYSFDSNGHRKGENGEAPNGHDEESDAEYARRLHEKDLEYAQRTRDADVEHQGIGFAAANTEQSDAEYARMIHERDLAYAQRNLGIDPEVIQALTTEESDAEYARRLHERDQAYAEKNRSATGDVVSAHPASSEESDAEYARRLHERDLAYALRNKNKNDDFVSPMYDNDRSQYDRSMQQGDAEYAQRLQEKSLEYSHATFHGPDVNASDARIAQEVQEADIDRVERIKKDEELALKLQEEEEMANARERKMYGYDAPVPILNPAPMGTGGWKDQDKRPELDSVSSRAGHQHLWQEEGMVQQWGGSHGAARVQPRPKTPPTMGTQEEDWKERPTVSTRAEHQKLWQEEVPQHWGVNHELDARPKTPPLTVQCKRCKQSVLSIELDRHKVCVYSGMDSVHHGEVVLYLEVLCNSSIG